MWGASYEKSLIEIWEARGRKGTLGECFQTLGLPAECLQCRNLWIEANKPEHDYYLISNRGDIKIKHMTGRP